MNSLRETRKNSGYTQEQLSGLTGIQQFYISNLENGRFDPNEATRQKFESILGKIDWVETTGVRLHNPNYYQAERLLKRLVELTLSMDVVDRADFNKLITKYFKTK